MLTADDCDDADATSTVVSEDGDCDGTVTADDCDDTDANSTTLLQMVTATLSFQQMTVMTLMHHRQLSRKMATVMVY